MAWRLQSEASLLYPVPLLGVRDPGEAIHSPNPGPKEAGTVPLSLALAVLSMGSPRTLQPQVMQGVVTISGTSVDTSVGTASRWGVT